MANKRWSQAEESQIVALLLDGNSIEVIANNVERSPNSVFSRLHHLGIISINSTKVIDFKHRDVEFKEEDPEIDIDRKCIECSEPVGSKRLRKTQTFTAANLASQIMRQVENICRVFALTSVYGYSDLRMK